MRRETATVYCAGACVRISLRLYPCTFFAALESFVAAHAKLTHVLTMRRFDSTRLNGVGWTEFIVVFPFYVPPRNVLRLYSYMSYASIPDVRVRRFESSGQITQLYFALELI